MTIVSCTSPQHSIDVNDKSSAGHVFAIFELADCDKQAMMLNVLSDTTSRVYVNLGDSKKTVKGLTRLNAACSQGILNRAQFIQLLKIRLLRSK